MSNSNRRDFLKNTSAGVASAAALAWAARTRTVSAANQVNVAIIGCGGRGSGVAHAFNKQPGVKVTYVCDAHQKRLAAAAKSLGLSGKNAVSDMRRAFDDPDVDAVYIATPDHWHAPSAILACDAGKHVYVEKPCSHNVREGRLLVNAASRNKVVVQHGTQVRSTAMMLEAIQLLRDGIIGDVLVCKAWNIQKRRNIGHGSPGTPPPELDYDLWVGPAPMVPYQENCVEGWHWRYDFGTGGIGNDGIHDVDYARWGLGVETQPSLISSGGGKYFFDDDQEFADTQLTTFEYPGDGKPGNKRMLVYEQRLWSDNRPCAYNVDSGVEYYGTGGRMFLSRRGKIDVRDEENEPKEVKISLGSQDTDAHIADFVNAIRTGGKPRGDVEKGHLTASLCHLGNLSSRLGRSIRFDPKTEKVLGDPEADALVGRKYRKHWGTPA